MKGIKATLYLLIVSAFVISCSVNDSSDDSLEPDVSEFFIKASIDGNESVFNFENHTLAGIRQEPLNDFYELWFSGEIPGEPDEGFIETISLSLKALNLIEEKEYNDPELMELGLKGAFIGYSNQSIDDTTGFVTDINNPTSSINITELTATSVRGTFSGIVKHPINDTQLSITNGEFYLKLN